MLTLLLASAAAFAAAQIPACCDVTSLKGYRLLTTCVRCKNDSGITAFSATGTSNLELTVNSFDGLSALRSIDLSNTGLTSLPPNVFGSLKLDTLDLSNNKLTNVFGSLSPMGGTSSIKTLRLHGNPYMQVIQADAFTPAASWKSLMCVSAGSCSQCVTPAAIWSAGCGIYPELPFTQLRMTYTPAYVAYKVKTTMDTSYLCGNPIIVPQILNTTAAFIGLRPDMNFIHGSLILAEGNDPQLGYVSTAVGFVDNYNFDYVALCGANGKSLNPAMSSISVFFEIAHPLNPNQWNATLSPLADYLPSLGKYDSIQNFFYRVSLVYGLPEFSGIQILEFTKEYTDALEALTSFRYPFSLEYTAVAPQPVKLIWIIAPIIGGVLLICALAYIIYYQSRHTLSAAALLRAADKKAQEREEAELAAMEALDAHPQVTVDDQQATAQ